MDTAHLFKTVNAARGYYVQHVADLSKDQLLKQPAGTNHNVLWNVGHIVYTNASTTYALSGLPSPIPASYEGLFKGGTSPANWSATPDIDEVMTHFKQQNKKLYEDYKGGKFTAFTQRELAPGYALESFEEANVFNCFHEGIHVGMVMKLRQLMGVK